MGFKSYIWRKKKTSGLGRVTSWPVGSTGFDRVVAPAGILTNPDRTGLALSSTRRSGFNNYEKNGFCTLPYIYFYKLRKLISTD
jgi:hypothetical protein